MANETTDMIPIINLGYVYVQSVALDGRPILAIKTDN